MPAPKPKKARRESENSEVLNWTDNEVELLLGVVRSYSSLKDFDGLEWESVKSKYEDIRSEFLFGCMTKGMTMQEDFPHSTSLFSRERIASKIKDLRKKYKKAVDTGKRSGGGRTVACFFDICNEIWGGCPSTTSIGHGLDTADFGVAVVTTANTEPVLSKSTTTQGSANSELKVRVLSDESTEVRSTISGQSTSRPVTPLSEDTESKGQAGRSNLQVTTSKRNLIENIKEKKDSKLTKSKSMDQLQLAVLKEELSLKKKMLSEIRQAYKEYQQTMAKIATTMENLSHSVSNAFGMISALLTRPGARFSKVPKTFQARKAICEIVLESRSFNTFLR